MELELQPAPVTLGRVTRYFELLCRFGFDEVFDRVERRPSGKPTKSLKEEIEQEDTTVAINLGQIYREIATGGALIDLGLIVFETEDRELIENCTADDFRTAFFGFARASHALFDELLVFGANYA